MGDNNSNKEVLVEIKPKIALTQGFQYEVRTVFS